MYNCLLELCRAVVYTYIAKVGHVGGRITTSQVLTHSGYSVNTCRGITGRVPSRAVTQLDLGKASWIVTTLT